MRHDELLEESLEIRDPLGGRTVVELQRPVETSRWIVRISGAIADGHEQAFETIGEAKVYLAVMGAMVREAGQLAFDRAPVIEETGPRSLVL